MQMPLEVERNALNIEYYSNVRYIPYILQTFNYICILQKKLSIQVFFYSQLCETDLHIAVHSKSLMCFPVIGWNV